MQFIQKMINKVNKIGKRVGKGVILRTMSLNDNKIDYVHWDDPKLS